MHTFAMNGTVDQEREARRSETQMTGNGVQYYLTWFTATVRRSFQKCKEHVGEGGQGVCLPAAQRKRMRKGSAQTCFRCLDKSLTVTNLEKGRAHLANKVTVHPSNQGQKPECWNLSRDHEGTLLAGLLPGPWSAAFLIEPMPTCQWEAQLTVG